MGKTWDIELLSFAADVLRIECTKAENKDHQMQNIIKANHDDLCFPHARIILPIQTAVIERVVQCMDIGTCTIYVHMLLH